MHTYHIIKPIKKNYLVKIVQINLSGSKSSQNLNYKRNMTIRRTCRKNNNKIACSVGECTKFKLVQRVLKIPNVVCFLGFIGFMSPKMITSCGWLLYISAKAKIT